MRRWLYGKHLKVQKVAFHIWQQDGHHCRFPIWISLIWHMSLFRLSLPTGSWAGNPYVSETYSNNYILHGSYSVWIVYDLFKQQLMGHKYCFSKQNRPPCFYQRWTVELVIDNYVHNPSCICFNNDNKNMNVNQQWQNNDYHIFIL